MAVAVEELTRASLLLEGVGKPDMVVSMAATNAAPFAATVSVVAETSEISVSTVATTIKGLFDQVPRSASSKSSSATPKAISPATSPPASSSTRIKSVTWASGRISALITVLGFAARLEDVWRTTLKTGFAGVTPNVVSRTLESLTRFVDCSTGMIGLLGEVVDLSNEVEAVSHNERQEVKRAGPIGLVERRGGRFECRDAPEL